MSACGAEFDFVMSAVDAVSQAAWSGSAGPWIGLSREVGTDWRWSDGTLCVFDRWDVLDSQPNGGWDLVALLWSWRNNDVPQALCHDIGDGPWTRSFIVEWSADCNSDGIVDKGQILSGELPDANNNGIPDGGPTITAQPVDQNVGVDSPVTFIVEVASDPSCTPPVTFQWQRRNPTVADPAAASAWIDLVDGGGFFGTRAPNLSISRPIPGLATGYRCKIGGGCGCEPGQGGFVYTNTVNFSVACPADFNADGGVDGLDLFAFFERWENGC